MQTATSTKTVTNTHLAIATLAMLGAGAAALAVAPVTSSGNTIKLQPNQVCRQVEGYGYNGGFAGIEVVNAQTGAVVNRLRNGCRDAGHGMRNYTLTCTANPNQYNVRWTDCSAPLPPPAERCEDRDGGANTSTAAWTMIMVGDQESRGDNVQDTCNPTNDSIVMEGVCQTVAGVRYQVPTLVPMECGSDFMCSNGACIRDVRVKWESTLPSFYPNAEQYIASTKDVANIAITNTKKTPVTITGLNVNLNSTLGTVGVRKLTLHRLVKQGTSVVKQSIATKSFASGSPYADTAFTDSEVQDTVIEPGRTVTFVVTIDLTQSRRDAQLTVGMGADDISWTEGGVTRTTAQGLPLESRTIGAYARVLPRINWAAGQQQTEMGTRSAMHQVAAITVSNPLTPGRYDMTVQALNFDITSNIPQGGSGRIQIFAGTVSGMPVLDKIYTTSTVAYGRTSFTDADFTDVTVSSGNSQTFFVFVDTTTALPENVFSIRVDQSGLRWTDGVIPTIYGVFNTDLPLSPHVVTF